MTIKRQFLRFALVGASGTTAQYAVLWVGTLAGLSAVSASSIGYALGSIVNYLLNYFFTFKSQKSHTEAASKYYAIVGIGWLINAGLMALLTQHLAWNVWLAQLVTTGFCLLCNFGLSRWWAFRETAPLKEE